MLQRIPALHDTRNHCRLLQILYRLQVNLKELEIPYTQNLELRVVFLHQQPDSQSY